MTIASPAALATPRDQADRERAQGMRLFVRMAAPIALLLIGIHLLVLHQGAAWTSPLLIGDHLFDVAFALSILWYSLALGRKVGRPLLGLSADGLTEGLCALGIGLGALSLLLLGLGFLHLYYGVVFLGGALALTGWLRAELVRSLRQIGAGLARWTRDGLPTASSFGQCLVLLILLVTLPLVLIRATVPASLAASGIEWDALAYHLAAPKVYLAAHAFVPRPDLGLANAPAGGDLLFIIGLAAGTDIMAKMLTVALALLLGVATFALGRRHFGPAAGWLGALLVYTNLWIVPIMPATVPDYGAAFMIVLGVSDVLAWAEVYGVQGTPPVATGWQGSSTAVGWTSRSAPEQSAGHPAAAGVVPPIRPRSEARHEADRLLPRAGLLIGMAVSFKLTNLPAAAALPIAVGLASLALTRGAPARRMLWAVRNGVLAGLATLVAPAPWLLKNLIVFGTPLYPAAVEVNDSGAHAMAALAGAGAHPSPAAHFWWVISTLATTYWHYITPLSPLLLAAPFLIRRPATRMGLLLLVVAGLLWLVFVPLYLPPRYWLGFVGVGDALTAAVVCEMLARRLRPPLLALLCVALMMDGAAWLLVVPFGAVTPFWLGVVVLGIPVTMLLIAVLSRRRERIQLLQLPIVATLAIAALVGLFAELREMDRSDALAVATGSISREGFLLANGSVYRDADWVNTHTPPGTTIVLVHDTLSYYVDRPYLADFYGARNARLQVPATRHAEFVAWCRAGVRYAIFNRGPEETDDPPGVHPLTAFAWARTPGLNPRVRFRDGDIDVLAITPCAAARST